MIFKLFEITNRNSDLIRYYAEHNKQHPTIAGISAIFAFGLAVFAMGGIGTAISYMAVLGMLVKPGLMAIIGLGVTLAGFILVLFHGVIGEWLGAQKPRSKKSEEFPVD